MRIAIHFPNNLVNYYRTRVSNLREALVLEHVLAIQLLVLHQEWLPNRQEQNNAINQQVNNSQSTEFKNSGKLANELLEVKNEQRMDARTTTSPITTDPKMATVEVSRGKNSRRKSHQSNE